MGFFFFFSPSFIIWNLLLFLFILEVERGHGVFFKENFTFKRGKGAWIYLFTIFFINYLYSFVTFLNS